MPKRKIRIYKGTDVDAFKIAGKKGKTPEQRSKIYHIEKRKKKMKECIIRFSGKEKYTIGGTLQVNNLFKNIKYAPQETILDVLRKYRNSELISDLSNNFSTVMVKSFGKKLNNKEKDIVRSAMALVISETLNKVLEKPLKVIDNIKMFIKIGQVIYKVLLKFNEYSKEYAIDANSIYEVDENNTDYQVFLLQYPKLKKEYEMELCEKNIFKCPICNGKIIEKSENNKVYYVCKNYLNGKCTYRSID